MKGTAAVFNTRTRRAKRALCPARSHLFSDEQVRLEPGSRTAACRTGLPQPTRRNRLLVLACKGRLGRDRFINKYNFFFFRSACCHKGNHTKCENSACDLRHPLLQYSWKAGALFPRNPRFNKQTAWVRSVRTLAESGRKGQCRLTSVASCGGITSAARCLALQGAISRSRIRMAPICRGCLRC